MSWLRKLFRHPVSLEFGQSKKQCWFWTPQQDEFESILAPDRSRENNDLRLYLNYFNAFFEDGGDNPIPTIRINLGA